MKLHVWLLAAILGGAVSLTYAQKERDHPGPIVTTVTFQGNNALSDQILSTHLSLKPGQPYSFDRLTFSQGVVSSLYQDHGYWAVQVSTTVRRLSNERVTVLFKISEGPRYHVGDVQIEGNRLLSEAVIRRELGVEPGDVFSQAEVYDGHRQLYLTGYFRTLDVTYSTTTANQVNIHLKVVENPTRYLKGSLGYGAESKERVSLGYEDRNFFGGARKFNVQAVHSGFVTNPNKYQTTLLQTGLGVPHFLGTRFEAQTDIAREWRRRESYDTRTSAWRSRLGRRFGQDLIFNFGYRYEGTRLMRPSRELEQLPQFTNISAAGPSFTYDNTGDPFLPFFGWRIKSSYEQGIKLGIGDLAFYKWEGKAGRFETVFQKWTIFAGTQFGWLRPHKPDREIPIFERFTLGGASTVRGYSERDLGPKDAEGAPLGGEAYAAGNLEVRRRLYKKIYGVLFIDGGQLWSRPIGSEWPHIKAHRVDDFRYGSGGGLRFHTPIGAIRLELGYQLNPETDSKKFFDRAAIHFSLGEVF